MLNSGKNSKKVNSVSHQPQGSNELAFLRSKARKIVFSIYDWRYSFFKEKAVQKISSNTNKAFIVG